MTGVQTCALPIFAALWPEADPAKGESSFRVTLGRLRDSLGDAASIERDSNGRGILELLTEPMESSSNRTVILITHDMDVASRAHRIVNIRDGSLEG